MLKRKSYPTKLVVNEQLIKQIIIDPHYQINHPSMNDKLTLEIVQNLDNQRFIPKDRKNPWEYFEADVEHKEKNYRLVWCLEDNKDYLGIINCYKKKKHDKK